MKKMISKIQVLISLFVLLFCAGLLSCENQVNSQNDDSDRASYQTVRFIANMENTSNLTDPRQASARSAAPGLDIGSDTDTPAHTMEYFAIARASGQSDRVITGNTAVLELSLASGHTWGITCGVRDKTKTDDEGNLLVYLSDYTEKEITSSQPVISHNFALQPKQTEGGSGTLSLVVSAEEDSGVSISSGKVKFICPTSWNDKVRPGFSSGSKKWNLTNQPDQTIPSGTYEIQIKCFDENNNLVYVSTQTVNIFDNMKTNKWIPDGEAIDDTGKFLVTADLVNNFLDTTLYVGKIAALASRTDIVADDNNAGTAYTPLAHLQAAINKIKAKGNGSDYRIYVSGEITGATDIDALGTTKARSITIEGYSGDNTKDVLKGVEGFPVVSVDTLVPLTFKNIKITDSWASGSTTTAGIRMLNYDGPAGDDDPVPTVNLEQGVLIGLDVSRAPARNETDHTKYGNKCGVRVGKNCLLNINGARINGNIGGITSYGEVNLIRGSINYNAIHGICLAGEESNAGSLYMEGGEINYNESSGDGGGIRTEDTLNRVEISGGTIKGNKADVGAGALIWGAFKMTGGVMENNVATRGGGAIWVAEGTDIEISGSAIIRNNSAPYGGALRIDTQADEFSISENAYIPYGVDGEKAPGKNDISLVPAESNFHISGTPGKHSKNDPIVIGRYYNPTDLVNSDDWIRGDTFIQSESTDISSYAECFKINFDEWTIKPHATDNKKLVLDAPIYVKQGGTAYLGEAADGSHAKPYESIAAACELVTGSSVDYTILIDGEVTGAQELPTVAYSETITAHSVTIKGANDLTTTGLPADILNGDDCHSPVLTLNNSNIGSGIYLEKLIIKGAENTLPGGGISLGSGKLILGNDLVVTDNKATYGAGINLSSTSQIEISGNVTVFGNTATSGSPSNIYLPDYAAQKIKITGPLTKGSGSSQKKAKIGITTNGAPTVVLPITFTQGYGFKAGGHNAGVVPGTYFRGDAFGVTHDGDEGTGEAVLAVSGGSLSVDDIYEDITIAIDKTFTSTASANKTFTFSATGKDEDGNDVAILAGTGVGQISYSYTLIYHGEIVPQETDYYTPGTGTSLNTITLGSSLPAGDYTVNVTATYNGTNYSAGFDIKYVQPPELSSEVTRLPAGTSGTISDGSYYNFGYWPQSIKASDVEIDESITKEQGAFTYYLGSDGAWYVKCQERASVGGCSYSDDTEAKQASDGTYYKYFKVQPIKWRKLTDNYNGTGKMLLFAENILISIAFFDYQYDSSTRTINGNTVRNNNYEYSRIRAYLNGISYTNRSGTTNTEFSENGGEKSFLQSAFTEQQQSKIADTTVINNASTTNTASNPYICNDVEDKVFLLSYSELTNTSYNFDSNGSRIRRYTDFALANGITNERLYWTRSPSYSIGDTGQFVSGVAAAGNIFIPSAKNSNYGVVPAICIDPQ